MISYKQRNLVLETVLEQVWEMQAHSSTFLSEYTPLDHTSRMFMAFLISAILISIVLGESKFKLSILDIFNQRYSH